MLAARVGVAVLVAPALYCVLGEPDEGWGGGTAVVARRAGFALLGAVVCFMLTANWVPEERSPTQGRGFQAFVEGTYTYRLSFTSLGSALPDGRNPRQLGLQQLRKAVEAVPESVTFRRTLGIAEAERGAYPIALQQLERAMGRLAERAPDRAGRERRLWRQLFGADPPAAEVVQAAAREMQGYDLGWFGRVSLIAAYQRRGEKAVPPPLRESVRREAGAYFRTLMSGMLVPFVVVPQLGLIVLVVAVVLLHAGVLRPVVAVRHPVEPILWESFVLMLALGMSPVVLLIGGTRPAPETQPGLYSLLLVGRDLLQVGAVAYLAWRLRRRGLTLAEVGLSTRDLRANVGIGVLAALVMTPAVLLVGFLTQLLTTRFFPNVAPPYHPLQGLTATSGSPEIRLGLFMAAAVGAPLLEETFFRGALFGALRRRLGFWTALVGSAAFFAALHPQLPLGFLPIALLGAGFAALYEWRQSLVPAMVAHALNNGMVFLMLSLLFPGGT